MIDLTAVNDRFNHINHVVSPVDSGRYDGSILRDIAHIQIISNVVNAVFLRGGCRCCGVRVLRNQNRALVNQILRCVGFHGRVSPGTDEFHLHGRGRANALRTEEKCRVAGDNFCEGISAYITDDRFVSLDLAVIDHFLQLHTSGNACQIPAFINRRESVNSII